ncbi:unnamed protein product [Ectocarpus sp. 12 AP-2014]
MVGRGGVGLRRRSGRRVPAGLVHKHLAQPGEGYGPPRLYGTQGFSTLRGTLVETSDVVRSEEQRSYYRLVSTLLLQEQDNPKAKPLVDFFFSRVGLMLDSARTARTWRSARRAVLLLVTTRSSCGAFADRQSCKSEVANTSTTVATRAAARSFLVLCFLQLW